MDEQSALKESQTEPSKPDQPMTFQEKQAVVTLLLLYFVQGIPLGLWGSGLSVFFIENGATFANIAILSLANYPFSFKILTAPILDSFYNPKVGKRRTYILPIQYLMAFLFFLMGQFGISNWIKDMRVDFVTVIGFTLIFLAAHQDIATDGWVLTSFTHKYVHLGAICQSIGQLAGQIFSSSILINLNSPKFCNQFIFTTPQETGLLSLEGFCYLTSFIILSITLYVNFLTREVHESQEDQLEREHFNAKKKLSEVFQNVISIIKNKNVLTLAFYLLTFRIGFQPVNTSTGYNLLHLGFPKEIFSSFSTIFSLFGMIISVYVGANLKKGSEMPWLMKLYLLRFVDQGLQFLLILFYDQIGSATLIFIIFTLNMGILQFAFICHSAFFNRISDVDVGGTYLTLLASLHNLGYAITDSISLTLIGWLGYYPVVFSSWIFAIVYLILMKEKILELSKFEISSWKITKFKN